MHFAGQHYVSFVSQMLTNADIKTMLRIDLVRGNTFSDIHVISYQLISLIELKRHNEHSILQKGPLILHSFHKEKLVMTNIVR